MIMQQDVEMTSKMKAYFKETEKNWNDHFQKMGFEFRISFKNYKHFHPDEIEAFENDGKLHKETIWTIIALLKSLFNGNNVRFDALLQSCKSPAQAGVTLLWPILTYLRCGKLALAVSITPSGACYEGQLKTKIKEVYALLRSAEIHYLPTGKKINVEEYFSGISKARNNAIKKEIGGSLNNAYDKVHEMLADPYMVLPLSSGKFASAFFKTLLKVASDNFWKLLVDRDESHHSAASCSINDSWFKTPVIDDKGYYDLLKGSDATHSYLVVSATGRMYNSEIFDTVIGEVDKEHYCGWEILSEVNGETVRPYMGVKKPDYFSLSEIGKILKEEHLYLIEPYAYTNKKTFRNNPTLLSTFKTWEFYRGYVEKSIAKIIKYFLIDNNKKGHRGFLLRFLIDNDGSDLFIHALKRILEVQAVDIKIIKHYATDENTPYRSVRELLDSKGVMDEGYYVIVPTAKARMGDSFPSHCGYGADFTKATEFESTLLQGILGRLVGYFKNPTFIVSDRNYQLINNYLNKVEQCSPPTKKFHPLINSNGGNTAKERHTIEFASGVFPNDPIINGIVNGIQLDILNERKKNGYHIDALGEKNVRINLWKSYIAPHWDYLNKLLYSLDLGLDLSRAPCLQPESSYDQTVALGPRLTLRNKGAEHYDANRGRNTHTSGKNLGKSGRPNVSIIVNKEPDKNNRLSKLTEPLKALGFTLQFSYTNKNKLAVTGSVPANLARGVA